MDSSFEIVDLGLCEYTMKAVVELVIVDLVCKAQSVILTQGRRKQGGAAAPLGYWDTGGAHCIKPKHYLGMKPQL